MDWPGYERQTRPLFEEKTDNQRNNSGETGRAKITFQLIDLLGDSVARPILQLGEQRRNVRSCKKVTARDFLLQNEPCLSLGHFDRHDKPALELLLGQLLDVGILRIRIIPRCGGSGRRLNDSRATCKQGRTLRSRRRGGSCCRGGLGPVRFHRTERGCSQPARGNNA